MQKMQKADLPKPSILILLVDDLGWGDVGYHDSTSRDSQY